MAMIREISTIRWMPALLDTSCSSNSSVIRSQYLLK
eukprot:CAMPEP_0173262562 /NCGR_PEP_ID=MMETSP1142-20121109/26850_1 /TAXON_ID=483371 /ORGANISM="non described non described, Strain CCMP2298" /LENGTH=35 /DNA_ID= /DNA_START= /DNA_END= /DNA_ORIENTATION=